MKQKHWATLLSIVVVLFGAWCTGFDFTERGDKAFITYLACLGFGFLAFSYPYYTDGKQY